MSAVDVTESDVMASLRAVLLSVLPAGVDVIQGQDNRVPEPASPDFVIMTPTRRARISTNIDTWDETNPDPSAMDLMQPTRIDIQLDIHGPGSTDNEQIISTIMRDQYACDAFAAINPLIMPLFADDAQQSPFVNAENQYEFRWTMNVALQANITVSTAQQFANTLTIGLIDVDVVYPPQG